MLVGLGFAVLVAAPFLLMSAVAVGYLLLLPFTIYRFEWLKRHPEAWDMPTRERRAVARAARSARRLGLRSPLRRRVAGGARNVARAVFRPDDAAAPPGASAARRTAHAHDAVATARRRGWGCAGAEPRARSRPDSVAGVLDPSVTLVARLAAVGGRRPPRRGPAAPRGARRARPAVVGRGAR